jgi:phosphoenolpyruvate synthase/pyruvate phosphate dikinase
VGGPGHPDLHRRHDLARGRGGPRLGQVLHRAAPARCRSTTSARHGHLRLTVLQEGDWISLNGSTGIVYKPDRSRPRPARSSRPWAAARKSPASTPSTRCTRGVGLGRPVPQDQGPHQRRHAQGRAGRHRAFGAEGIGLCRTEHMFFEGDRIWAKREFIVADTKAAREGAREAAAATSAGTSKASSRP